MEKKRVIIFGVITLLILVLLTVGIVRHQSNLQTKKQEPYTIGVVIKSSGSEYWMSVTSGMEAAAKEMGAELIILAPISETDKKVQDKLIIDLIEKGVDVLAISPIDSYDTTYLELAREREVPIISFDTRILQEDILYIGIDNYKAGAELAQVLIDTIGREGKVGIVTGDLMQSSHRERKEGFCDYLAANSEISVAFIESGYSNKLLSEEQLDALFTQHADLGGIFATSAVTAHGIIDYLKEALFPILTVDAQQDTMSAVREGKIVGIAAQSGYEIGYKTVQYILLHKEDDFSLLTDLILEADIITQENVMN